MITRSLPLTRHDAMFYGVILSLLFVWSVPGTIALRYGLLLVALTMGVSSALRIPNGVPYRNLPRAPFVALALFVAWLLVQALFISYETRWALSELRGQLLTSLVAGTIGILSVRVDKNASGDAGSFLWSGVVLVIALQSAIAIGQSLWHWVEHGSLLRHIVPLTTTKLELSFIVNIMLAVLAVDLFFRATGQQRFLRLPLSGTLACLALGAGANYVSGARNGLIGMVLLALTTTALFLFNARAQLGWRKVLGFAAALVIGMTVFGTASYKADSRWQVFAETARIAVDIDRHQAWYNPADYPLPLLANGQPVDVSAYQRIAWLSSGVRVAAAVPWGVGYGRNAYRRALERMGYEVKLGHAHSGFVDLLAGGGMPAVILWLVFVGTLFATGWRAFIRASCPAGLLLALLVAGFVGRMVIESVNRDHMLQMFFFLNGVLLTTIATKTGADSDERNFRNR